MDISQQDLEKLRLIAESNPNLKKTLEMYEQLTAFGGPAARQQEESEVADHGGRGRKNAGI